MAGLGQAVAKVGGRSRSLGLQGSLDHILACFKALKAYGCGPQGQAVAKVAGLSRSLWDMDGFFHIDQGRNANFELLELLRPCIVLGVWMLMNWVFNIVVTLCFYMSTVAPRIVLDVSTPF